MTWGNENPRTCLPACLMLTRKFSAWVYQSVMLPFLTNQVTQFISCGDIGCFYFSGNTLLLPFLLPAWFQDSSQIKAREGSTFSCLSIACLLLRFSRARSIFFIKCPVFHFLDLVGRILNLVFSYLKIQRKDQNLGRYSVSFLTPLSWYQPIIQFNYVGIT